MSTTLKIVLALIAAVAAFFTYGIYWFDRPEDRRS